MQFTRHKRLLLRHLGNTTRWSSVAKRSTSFDALLRVRISLGHVTMHCLSTTKSLISETCFQHSYYTLMHVVVIRKMLLRVQIMRVLGIPWLLHVIGVGKLSLFVHLIRGNN